MFDQYVRQQSQQSYREGAESGQATDRVLNKAGPADVYRLTTQKLSMPLSNRNKSSLTEHGKRPRHNRATTTLMNGYDQDDFAELEEETIIVHDVI